MAAHPPNPDRIAFALDPHNEAGLLASLRVRDGSALPWNADEIGSILEGTESRSVRNAAALALADLDAPSGRERILALVASPEIAPAAGTLLYALDKLGAVVPLAVFLNIIENGSYEARNQALDLLAEDRVEITDADDLEATRETLSRLAGGADPDAAEAASESIDKLDAWLSTGPTPGPFR